MPFESEAQRRWMYANHPEMAARWEAHTPKGKKLPRRVKKGAPTLVAALARAAAGAGPPKRPGPLR